MSSHGNDARITDGDRSFVESSNCRSTGLCVNKFRLNFLFNVNMYPQSPISVQTTISPHMHTNIRTDKDLLRSSCVVFENQK